MTDAVAGDASKSTFLPSAIKQRAPTKRPLYNPTDSDIEHYLTLVITEPILHYCIPHSVKPNTITATNATTCWTLLGLAYTAWSIETAHPVLALSIRFLCAVLVFASMLMDCLDGMQARRTQQGSLLGELLDHSFDAAHTCIFAVVMLTILQPDFYTGCFSLVCTGMVYNAQLVLYRHLNKMVNPPTNGPEAQLLLISAIILFSTFFYLVPRSSAAARAVIIVFSIGANFAQINNIRFFYKKLHIEYAPASYIQPALRFATTVAVLAVMAFFSLINVGMYWFCFIALAYRWNAHYLLYTILHKYIKTGVVAQGYQITENNWTWDLLIGLATIAFANHTIFANDSVMFNLLPLLFALYCLSRNFADLLWAVPVLASVQQQAKEAATPRKAKPTQD